MAQKGVAKLNAYEFLFGKLMEVVNITGINYEERQTHMLWIVGGLLIVQPEASDYLYIDMDKNNKDDKVKRVGSGRYYKHQEYTNAEYLSKIMFESYNILLEELKEFEKKGNEFMQYSGFLNEFDERAIKRISREIRFIIVGCIAHDVQVTMDTYQYLFMPIVPEALVFRPLYSSEHDSWLLDSLSNRQILGCEDIVVERTRTRIRMIRSCNVLGRFQLNIRPTIMLPRGRGVQIGSGSKISAVKISSRLDDVTKNMRKIHYTRNVSINETQTLEVEVDRDDSRDTINKLFIYLFI